MRRATASLVFVVACLVAAGCAPARFVEGVRYTADHCGVRSADSLGVAHRGYLRFDHALLSDLDDVLALTDVHELRAGGARILEASHAAAVRAADAEIDRMPPAALDELVRRYRLSSAPAGTDACREFLKQLFATRSRELLDEDIARLALMPDADDARGFLQKIRHDVEPPPAERGKLARALLAAPLFLPAAIGAEIADAEATQRLMTADFDRVVLYTPSSGTAPASAVDLESAAAAELAEWYAPMFVQQVDAEADYPAEDDRIGRVYLTGTADKVGVQVDYAEPTVYWAHQQAKIEQRRYDQLVYAAWYPRRPAMSTNDPSAGNIDGVVIRITLDRHHRPAIYEFVRSCGCYHTLWVAEFVEAAAREEFGSPTGQQRYAVQRPDAQRELFLPELVRDDGAKPHRPIAFVSTGYHLLMSIYPLPDGPPSGRIEARYNYKLEPYANLTRLPLGNGVASMFGSDGLVHNAGRPEGWLLAPTGMLSAGQPRQLGTMKIRMDAYDYDDPRLLERNLRLPSNF